MKMKTVELSALMAMVIENWCANLAELGCPKNEPNADMWFRNLSHKKQCAVCDKLLDIMDRDYKMYKESKKTKPSKKTSKILSKLVVDCSAGCSGKTKHITLKQATEAFKKS